MDERLQQEAGFGQENEEFRDDDLEDEIVLDEVPEEDLVEDDEEGEDDSEEEHEGSETKYRDKAQVRISRLTKERYNEANKAKKFASDAEFWRQKYELASKLALGQSDLNASARLDKARSAQLAAIESGDAQAQVDATAAISAAMTDLQEIQKEKVRYEYEERSKQYQAPQQYEQPDPEIAQEWLQENNDWINPQSKKYDQELHSYITAVDNNLGNELRAKGGAHHIGSLEYIDLLENHKNHFLSQRSQSGHTQQNTNTRRELNMKPARGGGSPVRNSSQSQHRNSKSNDITITPAERALLESGRQYGITDEIFLKYKRDDIMNRRQIERGEN